MTDHIQTNLTLDDLRAAGFKITGRYRNAGHYISCIRGKVEQCRTTPGWEHLVPKYQSILERLSALGPD